MTAKRNKARIHDPAEYHRLKLMGADVNIDKYDGKIVSARRTNVFTVLLTAGAITPNHHDAAYRLAEDWAEWKGLAGAGDRTSKVDGGLGCAELVTDRMISAGKAVARTLAMVGPMDRELLQAFMVATVEQDRPMVWRGIVERVTGITARDRQSTVIWMALENLRACYEQPRERVA